MCYMNVLSVLTFLALSPHCAVVWCYCHKNVALPLRVLNGSSKTETQSPVGTVCVSRYHILPRTSAPSRFLFLSIRARC